MKLVDNWKSAPKWFTMQISAGVLALATAWNGLPQEWKDAVPKQTFVWIIAAYAFAILVGRMFRKRKPEEKAKP